MTDASTTGAVERFDPYTDEGNREGYGEMEVQADGEWVRFTDYQALRERAEAAERTIANLHAVEKHTRDKANALFHMNGKLCADYDEACAERDEARRAEAAAWNDAIEAVALEAEWRIMPAFAASIRALRRAAPTEGESLTTQKEEK